MYIPNKYICVCVCVCVCTRRTAGTDVQSHIINVRRFGGTRIKPSMMLCVYGATETARRIARALIQPDKIIHTYVLGERDTQTQRVCGRSSWSWSEWNVFNSFTCHRYTYNNIMYMRFRTTAAWAAVSRFDSFRVIIILYYYRVHKYRRRPLWSIRSDVYNNNNNIIW